MALDAIKQVLKNNTGDDGIVRMAGACWIVTARGRLKWHTSSGTSSTKRASVLRVSFQRNVTVGSLIHHYTFNLDIPRMQRLNRRKRVA